MSADASQEAQEAPTDECGLERFGIVMEDLLLGHVPPDHAKAVRTIEELARVEHWLKQSVEELQNACANAGLDNGGLKNVLVARLAIFRGTPTGLAAGLATAGPDAAAASRQSEEMPLYADRADADTYVPEPKSARAPRADGEEDAPVGAETPKPKKPSKARLSEAGHTPQPRGRPPKGKMWDALSGTWFEDPHYVPAPPKPPSAKKQRVEGAPGCEGEEGDGDLDELGEGLQQKPKPKKTEDGMHAQPRGRPPSGKRWHRESGLWHDDPTFVAKPKVKKIKPSAITGASVVADNVEGAPYAEPTLSLVVVIETAVVETGVMEEAVLEAAVMDVASLELPQAGEGAALAAVELMQPLKEQVWDREKDEWVGLEVA
ncbi:hypothetical protein T492DRAFT_967598 [Pavlovales sp. CCMP2436]|nr:hypothetical protein T492DRAFT_967598 [Pavlovales sp. CCMP2436]|mmetsp:Transcript_25069/g.63616  ORF Transcript_25069/g.63616 Transcript_25069/m.63616 type:complete len:375 (+) Transcript_25069:121-1245(+)